MLYSSGYFRFYSIQNTYTVQYFTEFPYLPE